MKRPLAAILSATMLAGCAHAVPAPCPASPRAEAEIERTVQAFYQALRTDDLGAFRRVTTARFYSFDGGDRYDGIALAELIRDARAAGRKFTWSVGPLDTQRQCNVAWTAWQNSGSAGPAGQVKPVTWLESAVLVHDGKAWKIDFFHSHRATAN
ncbi:hypothetical protein GCM10023325_23830 [Sphingomonas lutea]